jgi:hypothetical protein
MSRLMSLDDARHAARQPYPIRLGSMASERSRWRVSLSSPGGQANDHSDDPDISADGRFVGFWSSASNLVAGDTNGNPDIFLRGPLT